MSHGSWEQHLVLRQRAEPCPQGGLHPRQCCLPPVGGGAGSRKSSVPGWSTWRWEGYRESQGELRKGREIRYYQRREKLSFHSEDWRSRSNSTEQASRSFSYPAICGSPRLHKPVPRTLCDSSSCVFSPLMSPTSPVLFSQAKVLRHW